MLLTTHSEAKGSTGNRRWESALLILAGLSLAGSLFLPIWRITLDAPQYPEGMGMLIWARTITGENPNDLDIINQLNHYIGMKKIIPESIPELRFIQPLVICFALACLLAAFRPRVWSTALLLAALTALGAFGMYDFWSWEYDYGHNLDPKAAIKVPGMSYQPPLIGSAKLLNFLSTSWPASGGYLLFLGGILIALSMCLTVLRQQDWKPLRAVSGRRGALVSTLCLGLAFAGCEKQDPVPFHWGEDACHHCKMSLAQKGFAAQRINAKGKVFKFDAIECLIGDLGQSPPNEEERVFVSDWSRPDADLSEAASAFFLKGESIKSPMGGGLAAFQSRDSAVAFQTRISGTLTGWGELLRATPKNSASE